MVELNDPEVTRSTILVGDGLEGTRIGPYRIVREIGRGGMGTVYLAVRGDDAVPEAGRAQGPQARHGHRGDRSAASATSARSWPASSIRHRGLLDGGTTPDGRPTSSWSSSTASRSTSTATRSSSTPPRGCDLFRKICAAVQHAHQNLVVHRDLKPANILVTADGTPKLLDFGIAKLLTPDSADTRWRSTLEGAPLMTPEYASPEQVRGEPVTTATDVYSLGVLLYELLTGRRPYRSPAGRPPRSRASICDSVPERPSTAVTDAGSRRRPAGRSAARAADARIGFAAGSPATSTPSCSRP